MGDLFVRKKLEISVSPRSFVMAVACLLCMNGDLWNLPVMLCCLGFLSFPVASALILLMFFLCILGA
jgi:hypothetical protein